MLNYLPPKSAIINDGSGEVFKNENKGLFIASAMYLLSDNISDTIIFRFK